MFAAACGSSRPSGARRRQVAAVRRRDSTAPRQIVSSAGVPTMPEIARPSWMIAILTVNSALPAINSLVPSSGSTRMKVSGTCVGSTSEAASSDTTATPGNTRARPSRMIASAASSASVTGLESALLRASIPFARTRMIATAACDAIAPRSSSRVARMRSAGKSSNFPSIPTGSADRHGARLGAAAGAVYQAAYCHNIK